MTIRKNQPVDELQREEVRHSKIRSSLVVEAGAGTGKTSLLIDRLLTLIKEIDITEIAAITFTEKAAAELKGRLRQALENRITDGFSAETDRYRKALHTLDRAQVATIHSFASSIIRTNALDIGIDPDFEHLESSEEIEIRRDVFYKALNDTDNDTMLLLNRYFHLGGKLNHLISIVESDTLYNERLLLQTLSSKTLGDGVLPVSKIVKSYIAKLEEIRLFTESHCIDPSDFQYWQIKELANFPYSITDEKSVWALLGAVSELNSRNGKQSSWDDPENCRLMKSQISTLKKDVLDFLNESRTNTANRLIPWIQTLFADIDTIKSNSSRLSFQDLLVFAFELAESPSLRNYLKDKYPRILIDEFQDTDPLQVDIALSLTAGGLRDSTGSDLIPEPGRLCLIGDPKQSIYRFRRADIRLFNKIKNLITPTFGERISIVQNFRSDKKIISFVNEFCGSLWNEIDAEISYEPMFPNPERLRIKHQPSVQIIENIAGDDPESIGKQNARIIEAELLSRSILHVIENEKMQIVDRDDSGEQFTRNAGYGDIVILFATTTELSVYASELAEKGIPYDIETGKSFGNEQIVIDLYNLITAVDNPADRLAVYGALRSNLIGAADRELYQWAESTGFKMDYREPQNISAGSVKDGIRILMMLHQKRSKLRPSELIEMIFNETSAIEALYTDFRGQVEANMLLQLKNLALQSEIEKGFTLREFRLWLRDLMQGDAKSETSSPSINSNRVRLMTIHSAKGLEFPIVALSCINWQNYKIPMVLSDRINGKIGVNFGTKNSPFSSGDYDQLQEIEIEEIRSEELRLIYVALTRACDRLILPCVPSKRISKYCSYLRKFINNESPFEDSSQDMIQRLNIIDFDKVEVRQEKAHSIEIDRMQLVNKQKTWIGKRQKQISKLQRKRREVVSPSQLVKYETTGYDNTKSAGVTEALNTGNALHEYLAVCKPITDTENTLIHRLTLKYGISGSRLIKLLQNCLGSSIWERACNAKRMLREVPFFEELDDRVVSGYIDLLWQEDDDSIHLCDWKTGIPEMDRYKSQIELYSAAVWQATGLTVMSANLFFAEDRIHYRV